MIFTFQSLFLTIFFLLKVSDETKDREKSTDADASKLLVNVADISAREAKQAIELTVRLLNTNMQKWEHDQGVGKMFPGKSSALNVHEAGRRREVTHQGEWRCSDL